MTVYASHCSYSLLVGPRGDVRVVSLMVNGYADIYKDITRKHCRTYTLSKRRSIITTGLKLIRISMLSTEPALSTVAVKPKITAFKTPSNKDKCYYWYCKLRWLTWQLSTVCPANTCKDFEALWVRRLVWVFSWSTCRFVGFAVHRLIYSCSARHFKRRLWYTNFTKGG